MSVDDVLIKTYGVLEFGEPDSKQERLHVFATRWGKKQKRYLHIRIFYWDKEIKEWMPSRKGVTISENHVVAFKKLIREFTRDKETFSPLEGDPNVDIPKETTV